MSGANNSDSSTSESEVSACSSSFNPLKALYSHKSKAPVADAPMFENIQQYEASKKNKKVFAVGESQKVKQREDEKERIRVETARMLEEKNKQRFAKYEMPVYEKRERKAKNLITRIQNMSGPLGVLKDCVDQRLRVKVITRKDNGIRGVLHATLVAFDRQWNLALSDVVEVWKRKGLKKRKVPPGLVTLVEKGTAAKISPVPAITETPIGKGVWECTRHLPQLMVRGEHVVLVNVVER